MRDMMSSISVLVPVQFVMVQVLLVWWSFVAFEIILPGQAEQSKTMNNTVLGLFVVGAYQLQAASSSFSTPAIMIISVAAERCMC